MSTLGLNTALYLQLRKLAALVDCSIVEQNRADTVRPASRALQQVLARASQARPNTPEALLLAAIASEGPAKHDLAALARSLAEPTQGHPSVEPLERLARRLESLGDEISGQILGR